MIKIPGLLYNRLCFACGYAKPLLIFNIKYIPAHSAVIKILKYKYPRNFLVFFAYFIDFFYTFFTIQTHEIAYLLDDLPR